MRSVYVCRKDAKSRISLNVHATPMKGAKLTGNVIVGTARDPFRLDGVHDGRRFNNLGY